MRSIKIRWATLVTIFSCVIMLIAIQPVSAATQTPSSASPFSSTHTTSIAVSAALCAQLKAHFPQQASDPRLYIVYHTESITSSSVPYKGACPGGTRNYSDTYWDAGLANWSLQLNTGWRWNNDCKAPSITYGDHFVNYYLWPVVAVNDQTYFTYYTNLPSQAAVYRGFIQFIGYGYTVWQRRECDENTSCNWHTDNG